MSSYQADWFVDDEGNFDAGHIDNAEDEEFAEEEFEEADGSFKQSKDEAMKAKMNEEFPDEIDTPEDTPARLRFARYRALQSFRSSAWHPKENLPHDYSKIFAFENFGMAQRKALASIEAVERLQAEEILQGVPKLAAASRSRSTSVSKESSDCMEVDVNELLVAGSEEHVKSGELP
jgi:pre-rRNA-processing protein TSR1